MTPRPPPPPLCSSAPKPCVSCSGDEGLIEGMKRRRLWWWWLGGKMEFPALPLIPPTPPLPPLTPSSSSPTSHSFRISLFFFSFSLWAHFLFFDLHFLYDILFFSSSSSSVFFSCVFSFLSTYHYLYVSTSVISFSFLHFHFYFLPPTSPLLRVDLLIFFFLFLIIPSYCFVVLFVYSYPGVQTEQEGGRRKEEGQNRSRSIWDLKFTTSK